MEYRNDLADILLSGLPDDERNHVVRVIKATDEEKLRRKRASGASPSEAEEVEYDDDREAAY